MNESNIAGMSIRGIIAFVVVVTLCVVCLWNRTDANVGILKDITIMILSFYFGQKTTQIGGTNAPNQTVTTTSSSVTAPEVKPS